jgi:hypothetical protein
MGEMSEKRKKQIEWNTRENWRTLKRNSEFLNTQIRGMIDELELNRENWQGSKGQTLAELQLKYMKLQADTLNLRIADIEGEME